MGSRKHKLIFYLPAKHIYKDERRLRNKKFKERWCRKRYMENKGEEEDRRSKRG